MATCLRCGADSSWLEGATRVPATDKRARANLRRRVLKTWKSYYRALGLDTSNGEQAEKLVPLLADVYEALGGRRLR